MSFMGNTLLQGMSEYEQDIIINSYTKVSEYLHPDRGDQRAIHTKEDDGVENWQRSIS
jgi:hypothetical protein